MGDTISSCCAVEAADTSKQTVKISNSRRGDRPSSGQKSSRRSASSEIPQVGVIQSRKCTSLNIVVKPPDTQGRASTGTVAAGIPFMLLDHSEVSIGHQKVAGQSVVAHRPAECSHKDVAEKADQSHGPPASRRCNGLPIKAGEVAHQVRAPVVPDDYEQMDSIRSARGGNRPRDRQEQRDTMGQDIETKGRSSVVPPTTTDRRTEDEANAVSERSTVTCSCSRSVAGSAVMEGHRKISISSSMCSASYCCSECNSSVVESSTPRESDGRCSCPPCANSLQPPQPGHCLCGGPSNCACASRVVQGGRCFNGMSNQEQHGTVPMTGGDEKHRSCESKDVPNGARQREDRGAVSKPSEGDKMWSLALPQGNQEQQRAPSLPSYASSSHCSELTSHSSCVTFSMEEKDSTQEQHTPGNMSENKHDAEAFSPSSPEVRPKFHTAPASDAISQQRLQGSSCAISFPSPCSATSFTARLQSDGAHSPSIVDHSGPHARRATEGCSNPSFYFTPPGSGGGSVRSRASPTGGIAAMSAATDPCTPPSTPGLANGGQKTAVPVPPVPIPGSSDVREKAIMVIPIPGSATTAGDTEPENNEALGGCTDTEAGTHRGIPSEQVVTNAGRGDGNMTSEEMVEEVTSFRHELQDGIGIVVLLQDGTRLLCQLTLSVTRRTLSIRCNEKVRILNVSDIQNLLYGRRELRKVETKANIKNDNCCVALHLVGSGNCIPLHFETQQRAMMFVDIIQHLKLTNTTATPSLSPVGMMRPCSSRNSASSSPSSASSSSSTTPSRVTSPEPPSVYVSPNC
eukprot:GHVS01105842.1.p1 GENE.GHVS01105842.1~~GHVS01105842.1.p1  ORF type:complete len:799 (+),score=85.68 GHVS01105842.1:421-2817(+)